MFNKNGELEKALYSTSVNNIGIKEVKSGLLFITGGNSMGDLKKIKEKLEKQEFAEKVKYDINTSGDTYVHLEVKI